MESRAPKIARLLLTPIAFFFTIVFALNIERFAEGVGLDEVLSGNAAVLMNAISTQMFAFVCGVIVMAAVCAWLPLFAKYMPTSWRIWKIPLKEIRNREFRNCNVPLDGHSYIGCKFKNVTLSYNGGRTEFSQNKLHGFVLKSHNPKISNVLIFAFQLGLIEQDIDIRDEVGVPIENTSHFTKED